MCRGHFPPLAGEVGFTRQEKEGGMSLCSLDQYRADLSIIFDGDEVYLENPINHTDGNGDVIGSVPAHFGKYIEIGNNLLAFDFYIKYSSIGRRPVGFGEFQSYASPLKEPLTVHRCSTCSCHLRL